MSDTVVMPTLSEEACQLALHSRHLGVSLHRLAWVKIEDTTVDRSLGDERARRHPILSPEEAKALLDYYRQSADAFTTEGDSERARVCAEAEANIRHAFGWPGLPSETWPALPPIPRRPAALTSLTRPLRHRETG